MAQLAGISSPREPRDGCSRDGQSSSCWSRHSHLLTPLQRLAGEKLVRKGPLFLANRTRRAGLLSRLCHVCEEQSRALPFCFNFSHVVFFIVLTACRNARGGSQLQNPRSRHLPTLPRALGWHLLLVPGSTKEQCRTGGFLGLGRIRFLLLWGKN